MKKNSAEIQKKKILDSAEALFAKEGFKGVSIREITTDAKCNQAMIHYYFGSKENLYLEVFRSRWLPRELSVVQCFKDQLAKLEKPTPAQVIGAYAKAYIDGPLTDSERQIQRLLVVRELSAPGEAFKMISEVTTQPITKIFLQHFEGYLIDDTDRRALTLKILGIYGMVYYFTYSRSMVSSVVEDAYDPASKEALIQSIVDFSLQGLPLKTR
jgi:TetR/AcrR family transcriptional regulator, regulator of cefoperazone and chloramphenicol sensitivity